MTSDQAFEILGITDKNIDENSLKKAFREAARNAHPDSNPDDKLAGDRFYLINEAYDVLTEYLKYEDKLLKERKKRAESAERVNRAKRTGSVNDSSRAWHQPKNAQTKQTEKDRWDYYAEADRKYQEEKAKQAKAMAEETLKKKQKLEKMRKAQEEWEQKVNLEKERRRKEQLERERLERERLEREFLEEEHLQRVQLQKARFRYIWTRINYFMRQQLAIETVLAAILLVIAIVLVLSIHFAGLRALGDFSRYIAMAECWMIVIVASRKVTEFSRRFFKGKIELVITFLLSFEIGLSIIKLIDIILRGFKKGLASIIIILIALLISSSYVKKIKVCFKSENILEKSMAIFTAVAYLTVSIVGILFGFISVL